MTFIILAVLVFLIFMVFRKYKTIGSTIIGIMLALGITTVVLLAGCIAFSESDTLIFFNNAIGLNDFLHLIVAWYVADVFCSILIIRNHIAYKKINAVRKNINA